LNTGSEYPERLTNLPKVTQEPAVRPGLAPFPHQMGSALARDTTCWPSQRG
jgi:hypothetical protein